MEKTAKASKLPPRMEMYEEERKQKEKQKKAKKRYLLNQRIKETLEGYKIKYKKRNRYIYD